MKKYVVLLLVILLLLLSVSCKKVDYHEVAFNKTVKYINSLNYRDLDTQMEILEAFKLDRDAYYNNFLKYVESAGKKNIGMEVVYEDKYIVIVEAKFDLVLNESFVSNKRFKKGLNKCTRYFTYKKYEDMSLVEILHKLIVRKEDSWIK